MFHNVVQVVPCEDYILKMEKLYVMMRQDS